MLSVQGSSRGALGGVVPVTDEGAGAGFALFGRSWGSPCEGSERRVFLDLAFDLVKEFLTMSRESV